MKKQIVSGALVMLAGLVRADDAQLAQHIASFCDYTNGIAVLARCDADGGLAVELSKQGGLVVFAQSSSQPVVDTARAAGASASRLNSRVYIEKGAATNLFLKSDYADLVTMPDLTDGELTQPLLTELRRVLCPNGRAVLGGSSVSSGALSNWLTTAGVTGFTVTSDGFGTWARFDKTRPAAEGDWSHWYCNPDNNPVTPEASLKSPYLSRFFMTPFHAAQPQMTLAANGRTFRVSGSVTATRAEDLVDAPDYYTTVTAHNGYNGLELWKRKWSMPMTTHKNGYVATADRFYMMDTNKILVLDAATGEEVAGMQFSGDYPFPKWMVLVNDMMYVLLGAKDIPEPTVGEDKYVFDPFTTSEAPWDKGRLLVAYDVNNWSNHWSHLEPSIIDARNIALSGNFIYFNAPSTNWNAASTNVMVPRVACLNRNTGALVWQNTNSADLALINTFSGAFGHQLRRPRLGMVASTNVLLITRQGGANLTALSATNGAKLWNLPLSSAGASMHMFLYNGDLYEEGLTVGGSANAAILNPLTGAKKAAFLSDSTGCARYTVSSNSIYCAGGQGYDLVRQIKIDGSTGLKADCNDSTIPANGGLYSAPQLCKCNVSARGFVAMEAAPSGFNFSPNAGTDRLEVTTNQPGSFPTITTNDWATYRGNNRRSASSFMAISNSSTLLWRIAPGTSNFLNAAVTAGGYVFLTGRDGVVRCVNAVTGKEKWSYATGARIMAAATVADGRVYAGSGDGFVYCLSASDGALLWRYRLAPSERWINLYGQMGSTWPVDTGVLVESGKVYAAAGTLDINGTHVFCLNATNGTLVWQNSSSAFVNTNFNKGIAPQGYLSTAKGKLWMPGGPVCSPASYDLATGASSNGVYGFKRNLRGRDMGMIADDLLVFGGHLLYGRPNELSGVRGLDIGYLTLGTAGESVYNEVSVGTATGGTALMPAWRADRALAHVADDTVSSWNTTQMVERIKAARSNTATQSEGRFAAYISDINAWQQTGLVVYGLAMGSDAGLMLQGNVPAYLKLSSRFWMRAVDMNSGATIWSNALPAEPLIGAMAVDKNGSVIVPLTDGTVVAYADPQEVAMIECSPDPLSVPENGTNTLAINLSMQPAQSVTVTVARLSGDTDISVAGGGTLVFNTSNWSVPQTAAVCAVNDGDALRGTTVLGASADGYATREVTVQEADDDLLLIDFGKTTTTTTNSGWNNITTTTAGSRLTDAISAAGRSTAVDVRFVDRFNASVASTSPGPDYYPATAWGDCFSLSATYTQCIVRLEQLDTNKQFSVVFYGARNKSGTGSTLTWLKAGGQSVALETWANTTNTVTLSGITASSSGTVDMAFSIDTGSGVTEGYLNVLEIGMIDPVSEQVPLITQVNGPGSVSPAGSNLYAQGTQVQITATASNYYYFGQWQGSAAGSQNPVTLTMDSAKTVTAVFAASTTTQGVPHVYLAAYTNATYPTFELAAAADPDADGLTTAQEYIAGTLPDVGSSVFALNSLTQSVANQSVIRWSGVTGRVYDVYWSSNLLNGFSAMQSNVPSTQCTFTDSVHGTEIQGFYKIKVRLE